MVKYLFYYNLQTNTCCSNKTISQQGAAIEDLKAQVASLQAKIQALESQKYNLSK